MRRIQRDQRETQSIVTTNSLSNFLISQSRKNLLAISFFYGLTRPSIDFLSRPGSRIQQRRGSDRKAAAPPIDSLSPIKLPSSTFSISWVAFINRREERNLFSVRPVCVCWPVSLREEMLWAGMKVYLRTGGSGALSRQ
jgi:hypothetical protein